jgi:high frequency lysogenization protein
MDVETCLSSLIKIDAASSDDVYGGAARLRTGLRLLEQQLDNPRDMELTRYVVALLGLERKLARRPICCKAIAPVWKTSSQNLAHFPVDHSNAIARFAEIYLNSLSTLSPRIMVSGDRCI